MPRFSRPLREAGKYADINTTREGKKPGRARLQSCRQPAPTSPGSAAERRKNAAHGASRGGSATNPNQAPEGRKKRPSNQTSAVREQNRKPRHLGETRVRRFSRRLREAGKFADINTNQEGKKPGRARLQSCRQASTNVPGFSRGAAQECSPRRKPWGQRHKPQPSPGGAKEPNPKYIAHRTQRCSS